MSDPEMTSGPMAAPPRKPQKVRERREKPDGPYTRFLEWASLSLPGFWRLRLDILLIGYLVLFLGAISTPITLSALAGPNDSGYNCDDYRRGTEEPAAVAVEEAAAPAAAPAFLYTQDDLDQARLTLSRYQSEVAYWTREVARLTPAALAAGASAADVSAALQARQAQRDAESNITYQTGFIAEIEAYLAGPAPAPAADFAPAPAPAPAAAPADLALDGLSVADLRRERRSAIARQTQAYSDASYWDGEYNRLLSLPDTSNDRAARMDEAARLRDQAYARVDAAQSAIYEYDARLQSMRRDSLELDQCAGRAYIDSQRIFRTSLDGNETLFDSAGRSNLPERGATHVFDYSDRVIYTKGFNPGEQGWITAFFVILALAIGLSWAFIVVRGTRLRDVVARTNSPGFLKVVLGLLPLVLLPLFAGFVAFAHSHGIWSFDTLFRGIAVFAVDGEPVRVNYPSGSSDQMPTVLLMFGVILAGFIAISVKIVMFDGAVGLIRSLVLASVMGALTFGSAFVTYLAINASGSYTTAYQMGLMVTLAWLPIYLLTFMIDIFAGVRRPHTRPMALSFPLWLMGWLLQVFVFASSSGSFPTLFGGNSTSVVFWLTVWASAITLALGAFTFAMIARISLLPRP